MNTRTSKITVRVTPAEATAIRHGAAVCGVTLNDFVVGRVLASVSREAGVRVLGERLDALEAAVTDAIGQRDDALHESIDALGDRVKTNLTELMKWLHTRLPAVPPGGET